MNIIDDITKFIFVESKLEKGDIIMIPGGASPELTETAAKLWKEGYAPIILPSGKYSILSGKFEGPKRKKEIYNGNYKTECDFMVDIAVKCGVPEQKILREDQATFTKENALFSRKVIEHNNLDIKRAIICCKSFHARRVYMYYKMAFPEVDLIIIPVDVNGTSKESWYKSEHGIELVMGELRRCGEQFKDEFISSGSVQPLAPS
jgi:uncharacterized SAM-binding protein YcdF (DUF218 family)